MFHVALLLCVSVDYGFRWHIGDVIGCMIDMDTLNIQFTVNGEDLGVAFTEIDISGGVCSSETWECDFRHLIFS